MLGHISDQTVCQIFMKFGIEVYFTKNCPVVMSFVKVGSMTVIFKGVK